MTYYAHHIVTPLSPRFTERMMMKRGTTMIIETSI